jgi:hypothetical protein
LAGRLAFLTAGLGNNPGGVVVRSPAGRRAFLAVADYEGATPIPVHVLVAPNNRHVYVTTRDDASFGEGAGGP